MWIDLQRRAAGFGAGLAPPRNISMRVICMLVQPLRGVRATFIGIVATPGHLLLVHLRTKPHLTPQAIH